MSKRAPLSVRVAATLVVPTSLAMLMVSAAGGTAGGTGCATCTGKILAVNVQPPLPASFTTNGRGFGVYPSICNVGDERVTIDNQTPYDVALTSAFFAEAGGLGADGGTGVNAFTIPAFGDVTLIATPNAIGAYVVSLTGEIAETPITVTIYLGESDGGAFDASPPDGGQDVRATTRSSSSSSSLSSAPRASSTSSSATSTRRASSTSSASTDLDGGAKADARDAPASG